MFTLYSADITGNPGNCSYPRRHDVTDKASLKAAICHDSVSYTHLDVYKRQPKELSDYGISQAPQSFVYLD